MKLYVVCGYSQKEYEEAEIWLVKAFRDKQAATMLNNQLNELHRKILNEGRKRVVDPNFNSKVLFSSRMTFLRFVPSLYEKTVEDSGIRKLDPKYTQDPSSISYWVTDVEYEE